MDCWLDFLKRKVYLSPLGTILGPLSPLRFSPNLGSRTQHVRKVRLTPSGEASRMQVEKRTHENAYLPKPTLGQPSKECGRYCRTFRGWKHSPLYVEGPCIHIPRRQPKDFE